MKQAGKTRSGFLQSQLKKLSSIPDRKHIRNREVDGRQLSYVEGWYAIERANAIFGFAGWDRETVHFERVSEQSRGDSKVCGYVARVRITVRAGDTCVVREGTGWGSATASTTMLAHERALKSAETDATKRALTTFGSSFGLNLYERESGDEFAKRPVFALFASDGGVMADSLSPEALCSGLRQSIALCQSIKVLEGLRAHNGPALWMLRDLAPQLCNVRGTHFSDLLMKLFDQARARLSAVPYFPDIRPAQKSSQDSQHRNLKVTLVANLPVADADERTDVLAEQPRIASVVQAPPNTTVAPIPEGESFQPAAIDKSYLKIGFERRLRDKDHLRKVAELPCLICNRQPSHAHHLRFAQRRGLGQKVSDEFVVPLCALHHSHLHRSSSEISWWQRQKIEPIAVSQELWQKHHPI